MRSAWGQMKLRDVCELINGRAYSKSELLAKGKYPVLRVGNFFTNNNWYYSNMELGPEKYCDNGDLLYAWSASFGPRIWEGGKVIFHYHIWKVQPVSALIDKKFLFMWFLWDTDEIKKDQGAGTTMLHVSKGSMEDRNILVPPLSEQKRVVCLLEKAFTGVESAIANAQKNLKSARALFESHLQSFFSVGGEAWTEKPLGELAQFKNGLNYNRHSNGQTLSVVGVADFKDNYFVPLSGLQPATIEGELAASYAIQKDDILTVRSNGSKHLVGRCMLVGELDEVVSYSGFIIRIRFDSDRIFPKYLLHFMKCQATRDALTSGGGGANITNINQEKLSALPVPLPPYSAQVKLAFEMDAMLIETERLESIYQQKIEALLALKKSLLHQAFSGML